MSNEVTTSKTFEQRMFEKVRESIGDLMTEEDLKKIVEKAMQKAFFEDRVDNSDYHAKTIPAVFVVMMQEEMRIRVDATLKFWLVEHSAEVQALLQEVVDKGIMDALTRAMETRMSQPLNMFVEMLRAQGVFK